MKNLLLAILLVAVLVFGGLYVQQTRKARQAEISAEAARQQASELQSNQEQEAKRVARMKAKLDETRADAAAKAMEAAQAKTALESNLTNHARALADAAATGSTNAKPVNALAAMFNNPEMKELIKTQQKTALASMLDKNYSKLFSDLHLTPEQTTSLKEMLLSKQLAATDLGMSMFTDNTDATKRADLVAQVKSSTDAADAQIKAFLGDDNFTQLQTYEKSMAERMSVSGFKDQLGSGPTALTPDQEQQLIQAMSQQRENFKFSTDLSDKSKFNGDFSNMFTEEKVNTFFQEFTQLNQQYLSQAQNILTPDQYKVFSQYLDSQQAMQKMGMQMAAKMFAPAKAGGN